MIPTHVVVFTKLGAGPIIRDHQVLFTDFHEAYDYFIEIIMKKYESLLSCEILKDYQIITYEEFKSIYSPLYKEFLKSLPYVFVDITINPNPYNTMSKFKKFLSRFGEEAYKSRAERILKQAQSAQTDLIRGLESKIIELENQLEDLLDVAPDSTTSTVVKSIDAKKIVTRYHEVSVELEMHKRELAVAKTNTDVLFGSSNE